MNLNWAFQEETPVYIFKTTVLPVPSYANVPITVLNPVEIGPVGSGTLSNGNLTITTGSMNGTIYYPSSGKYYTELNATNIGTGGGLWFGVFASYSDYVIYKTKIGD